MAGIERILAAVDFSEYTRATLEYAVLLGRSLGAEIILLNVLNQRDVDSVQSLARMGASISLDDYVSRQTGDRERQLAEIVAGLNVNGLKFSTLVKVGIPVQEILKTIIETKAGLVTMGTKGRTNLASTLFGSTAEKVFRRSPVPVLSVRGNPHTGLLETIMP